MTTSTRLGFRVKGQDETAIQKLSEQLERNISDTVRFAIRYTARAYGVLPAKKIDEIEMSETPQAEAAKHSLP